MVLPLLNRYTSDVVLTMVTEMKRDAGNGYPCFRGEYPFDGKPGLVVQELGDPAGHDKLGDQRGDEGSRDRNPPTLSKIPNQRIDDAPVGTGDDDERQLVAGFAPLPLESSSLGGVDIDVNRGDRRPESLGIREGLSDWPSHVGDQNNLLDLTDRYPRQLAAS